ncbi:hypothetical protein [Pseudoduganella armeniaca]|uniref:Uncharacterized protein n=1 Tax=Pseudoduganella armeniaca TaxID=2072590 RepID=A0A2R4CFW3_9BURK|nr:hypothetical protein [Pseudoduganella armeniaca]AVR98475.1 hypothetical protein C9I28_24670 [Pseudoduganella armeniaca]
MLFIFFPIFFLAGILSIIYFWQERRFSMIRTCYIAGAMCVFPIIANEAFQYIWYKKAIPEKIGITYPISTSDETGFREGCGTIVFKLSAETLAMIKKDGLKFFAGATQGRGHPDEPYYAYAEWQETPLPPDWTSEGSWMPCSELSHSEHAAIVSAAKAHGAYYTTKEEGQLVLIPSLGYIVYSFFG